MNLIVILLFLAFLIYLFERNHHEYIFWAVLVFLISFSQLTNSKSEKEVETLRKEIQKKNKEIEELRSSVKIETPPESTKSSPKDTVEKQEPVSEKNNWEKEKSW